MVKDNKTQESEREMLLASNRSLADFNLSYEPKLDTGKKKLRELTERAQELCMSVQNKATELSQRSGSMSLDAALALLQTAAAESEEESEALAERYLASDIDLESFLEQFLIKRKEMHLRRVKAEKMSELIVSPTRPAPPIPARAPYPVNTPPYPATNHSPYPPYPSMAPMNMPHPPPY
ncbi:hypothetical protein B566_EDAN014365 [Ephemera danica]|nr:hypothetical protein B566_EDAN014365 [Ephemera danica]